ncbi:MAG: WD40 repeat domain-containing protein, partial [Planctomycetota bacterium]
RSSDLVLNRPQLGHDGLMLNCHRNGNSFQADVRSGDRLVDWPGRHLAVSGNGDYAAWVSEGRIHVGHARWPGPPESLWSVAAARNDNRATFSADSTLVVLWLGPTRGSMFRVRDGECLVDPEVNSDDIAWVDDHLLVNSDGTLFDEQLAVVGHLGDIGDGRRVAASADGSRVAVNADGVVHVLDVQTRRELWQQSVVARHPGIAVPAVLRDGRLLIGAHLYAADDGRLVRKLGSEVETSVAWAFSDAERHIAMLSRSRLVVFETSTGEEVFSTTPQLQRQDATGVAIAPDGEHVAALFAEGSSRWYRVATGRAVRRVPAGLDAAALSPDYVPELSRVIAGDIGRISPDRNRLAVATMFAIALYRRR